MVQSSILLFLVALATSALATPPKKDSLAVPLKPHVDAMGRDGNRSGGGKHTGGPTIKITRPPREPKTKKRRSVPLSLEVRELLDELLERDAVDVMSARDLEVVNDLVSRSLDSEDLYARDFEVDELD